MTDDLRGRQAELSAIRRVVSRLPDRPGLLVVRGGAGIGKSSLLAAAAREAAGRGIDTLSLVGVQSEFRMPFAAALTLLGMLGGTEPVPEPGDDERYEFQLGLALRRAATVRAADRPLLIVVDDAQWLDSASWAAMGFAGRHVESDPIVVLLGMRDGAETEARLDGLGALELRVEPLSEKESAALLGDLSPGLSPLLRGRVLAEAAGNPLALAELAVAAARAGADGLLLATLPLTTRLERAFGAAARELPPRTWALLLVAALDDGDRLDEFLAAGALGGDEPLTVEDAEPAIAARLIDVDDAFRLHFRHPLVRSAIREGASLSQRLRAHAALAGVAGDPDRAVWHRAAATVGTDDGLAEDLGRLARRLMDRGAPGPARQAWERAARLTSVPGRRSAMLLQAAVSSLETGDLARVDKLLPQVLIDELSPDDQVLLWLVSETTRGGTWSGASRLRGHLDATIRLRDAGRPRQSLLTLWRVALRTYHSNPDADLRAGMLALLDSLGLPPSTPRLVGALGLIAPLERGAEVVARTRELLGRIDLTAYEMHEISTGASGVGALGPAAQLAADAVELLREQGHLVTLTQALVNQAWIAAQRGNASLARTAAAEAEELAADTGQRNFMLTAMLSRAQGEALRGNGDEARMLAEKAEQVLLSIGAHTLLGLVRIARGVQALADARFAEAHEEFDAIFEPSGPGYHPYLRLFVLAHLAEAGVASDRRDSVARRVREVESITGISVLTVGLTCARAMLADADEELGAALGGELSEWPFERARLQLAYGSRVRRRRPALARPILRAAVETFDALGARPWAERAQAELRASGETRRRTTDATDQLTPQELQVARLVAEGLSNREIAGRLFVSPRTISSHLYRIYPKVGVSSRTELATVVTRSYVV
ncbi:AAA family ATPase [Actinoplanes sp. TBRC 11911]|uniref:helix-turn-helix transcriptional regulator n=1 Tax=Actinoplanes sp. TBRC 11911 TaxID=2729386 RepID=UPI00145C9BB4|nr:LuxR family transcriptional regulator [Actinoplanes sp. TBRC 11911]NMO53996.1 AAA family ATPase [Actinoplanes sp. TBRC 11911]